MVFANLDGCEVLIFVMHMYEYGDCSPKNNRGRVYLSWVDSVPFLQK